MTKRSCSNSSSDDGAGGEDGSKTPLQPPLSTTSAVIPSPSPLLDEPLSTRSTNSKEDKDDRHHHRHHQQKQPHAQSPTTPATRPSPEKRLSVTIASMAAGGSDVLSLKRVTDGVVIPHNDTLCPQDAFTIEFWMNPEPGKCTTSVLVSKTDDSWGSGYIILYGKDRSIRAYHSGHLDDPTVEVARDAVQPGRWAHICCVYTGRALEIYVNGMLAARTGFAHRKKVDYGRSNEPFCIGHRRWGKSHFGFVGLIAELRVWAVAKKIHEIPQLMQGLPLCSAGRKGLVLHLRFASDPAALSNSFASSSATATATTGTTNYTNKISSIADDDNENNENVSVITDESNTDNISTSYEKKIKKPHKSRKIDDDDDDEEEENDEENENEIIDNNDNNNDNVDSEYSNRNPKNGSGIDISCKSVIDSSGMGNDGILVGRASLDRLKPFPVVPFSPSFSLRALCLVELSRMAAENTAAAAAAAVAVPFSVERYHSTGEGKDFIGGAKCEGVPRRSVLIVSVPSLRFKLKGPAPIGTPLTETFVLTNPTTSRVSAQLPKEVSTHAYNLQFEPSFVNIRAGSNVSIKATLLFNCTTSLHADVALALFSPSQRTPSPLLAPTPGVVPPLPLGQAHTPGAGSNQSSSASPAALLPGAAASQGMTASSSSSSRFKRKHDRAPDVVQTLRVDVDSELSSRLDYAELQTEQEPIGEGTFGVVYRGTWRGTPVAVKRLKSQFLTKIELEEFKGEVELMERLRSQYIANFIGAVFTRGHLALVTEFVPLGSVKSLLLAQNRKIHSPRIKFRIVHDTACALNFLHQNNILHRDIKTGNILVCSLSTRAAINAKLIDFGTSRPVATVVSPSSSSASSQEDEVTSGIGTPAFMAPEILDNKQYTKSADVYSFAIMMYELWTEKSPYSSNTKFPTMWGKKTKNINTF